MDALRIPLCTICNIKFENRMILDTHMKVKHNETQHLRIERLTEGVKKVRQGETSFNSLDKKSYDCTECGLLFSTGEELNIHNASEHDNFDQDQVTSNGVQIMIDDLIEKVVDLSETESLASDNEEDDEEDEEEDIHIDYVHNVEKVSCEESFKGKKTYVCANSKSS